MERKIDIGFGLPEKAEEDTIYVNLGLPCVTSSIADKAIDVRSKEAFKCSLIYYYFSDTDGFVDKDGVMGYAIGISSSLNAAGLERLISDLQTNNSCGEVSYTRLHNETFKLARVLREIKDRTHPFVEIHDLLGGS